MLILPQTSLQERRDQQQKAEQVWKGRSWYYACCKKLVKVMGTSVDTNARQDIRAYITNVRLMTVLCSRGL